MARVLSTTLVPTTVLLVLLLLVSVPISMANSDTRTDLINSIKTTLDVVRNVMSVVSRLSDMFNDFRASNAVNDCLDLLDFSAEELDKTAAVAENPSVQGNGTGNHKSDLSNWMSAALENQETCMDGFEGTDGIAKTLVGASLQQVTPLIFDILKVVAQIPSNNQQIYGRKLLGDEFPAWMSLADRRLLQASVSGITPDVTVAADGSGNFKSVMDAVAAAPDRSTKRFVIYVKKGVYVENVDIKKKKYNLMIIGDGMENTIISGSRNFVDGWTTFRTATFAVAGQGFIARDITFRNTAGPEKHQAVALRTDSDLSVFYRCGVHGYQDSLYAHSLRQFYRECRISGTIDFIFGNAAAVFQNCEIILRKPLPNQKNTITAQGRKYQDQTTGFSMQFCNISADSDLLPSLNSTQNFLGRPWKQYSRTVFMQSHLSDAVRPEGWLPWLDDFALDTLFYGEYLNTGPGAGLSRRVNWPGFHVLTDPKQASDFTVSQFIDGNLWLPSTGVTYVAGLSV